MGSPYPLPLPAIPYRAPNNASSTYIFSGRSRHGAIVLGSNIYIHGGEVLLWNGTGSSLGFQSYVNEYTFAIDLSTSWEIQNVVLEGALSTAPSYNSEALWLDETGSSFYSYDGSVSFAQPEPSSSDPAAPNTLWRFTPSRNVGSWEQISPPASSNFSQLVRINNGAYAYGGGLGFAVCGNYLPSEGQVEPTPGIVMFNSSSTDQPWYNFSTSDYSSSGISIGGAAHFVPDFGPQGLLFVIGGATDLRGDLDSTDSVAIFELSTQQWVRQKTTGDQPLPPQNPCLVGAKGDNGTYEIFMYGGRTQNRSDSAALNSVFVLSLPSFIWQKENSTPDTGRYLHTCNVVGSRQMMVIGGLVTNATVYESEYLDLANGVGADSIPDSWPQGIGLFDLSEYAWKDSYDSDAKSYVTPDIVKNGIQANGFYPTQWASPQVEKWFQVSAKTTALGPTASTPTPSASTTPSGTSSTNHTGAIVGGTIGGVAGLALLLVAILLLLRWRKARRRSISGHQSQMTNPTLSTHMFGERKFEAPDTGISEMDVKTALTSPRELGDTSTSNELRELPTHEHR